MRQKDSWVICWALVSTHNMWKSLLVGPIAIWCAQETTQPSKIQLFDHLNQDFGVISWAAQLAFFPTTQHSNREITTFLLRCLNGPHQPTAKNCNEHFDESLPQSDEFCFNNKVFVFASLCHHHCCLQLASQQWLNHLCSSSVKTRMMTA